MKAKIVVEYVVREELEIEYDSLDELEDKIFEAPIMMELKNLSYVEDSFKVDRDATSCSASKDVFDYLDNNTRVFQE